MTKYAGPVYTTCTRCPNEPGQVVSFPGTPDAPHEALCFTCWTAVQSISSGGDGTAKVEQWINKYGRIMFWQPEPVIRTYRLVIAVYPHVGPSNVTTVRVLATSRDDAMERGFNAIDRNLATYQHVRRCGILRWNDLLPSGSTPVIDDSTYDMEHGR